MHDQATKRYLTICCGVMATLFVVGLFLPPVKFPESPPRVTQVPMGKEDCVNHVYRKMTLADMSTFHYEWRGDYLHWKVKTSWNDSFRTDSAHFPGVSSGRYTHDTTKWYVY